MDRFAELAIAVLVNAAWQLPLLVLAAKLVSLLLGRAPAAYVHRLWLLPIALGLVLPLASTFSASAPRALPAPPPVPLLSSPSPVPTARAQVADPGPIALPVAVLGAAGKALLGLYLLLVAGSVLRLTWAFRRAALLARRSSPIEHGAAVLVLANQLKAKLGVGPVRLLASDELDGPVAVGILRPAVILPRRLLGFLEPARLEAVLCHELAHVARRDCAVQLAAELLLLPLSPHPAAWWLRAELARAREMACDETAAALTGARRYARSLLDLAVTLAGRAPVAATLGALDAHPLEARMKRLLNRKPRLPRAQARWALSAAALVLALAGWAAAGWAVALPQAATALAGMVGVWRGDYDEGEGKARPAAVLTVTTVEGEPRVAVLMYRYLKQSDGSLESAAIGFPVVEEALDGSRILFRTRDDTFRFRGGPKESVDYKWAFERTGDNEGLLTLLHNSRFEAEAGRGKSVPPPPPPIPMRKDP